MCWSDCQRKRNTEPQYSKLTCPSYNNFKYHAMPCKEYKHKNSFFWKWISNFHLLLKRCSFSKLLILTSCENHLTVCAKLIFLYAQPHHTDCCIFIRAMRSTKWEIHRFPAFKVLFGYLGFLEFQDGKFYFYKNIIGIWWKWYNLEHATQYIYIFLSFC